MFCLFFILFATLLVAVVAPKPESNIHYNKAVCRVWLTGKVFTGAHMSGAVLQLLACSPTAACIDKRGLQSRGGCRTLQQLSDANPRFEVDS